MLDLKKYLFNEKNLEHVSFGMLDSLNNLKKACFEEKPWINFNAGTPAEVKELKLKLQNQCPSLTTTTTTSST